MMALISRLFHRHSIIPDLHDYAPSPVVPPRANGRAIQALSRRLSEQSERLQKLEEEIDDAMLRGRQKPSIVEFRMRQG